MTRVALYARYSSDQQRVASIEDQLRVCREFASKQKWTVAAEFSDAAFSGASLMRPGVQAMIRQAMSRAVDVVLAESLDRFSRDQEDTAGLFKRLNYADVRLVTVAEGDITHLHVGFKGTMNALYLDDNRTKTKRGMRGRVEAGKSGGGISYGYRVVRVLEGQPRGDREIHGTEAAIVRRIFQEFVNGDSPKVIARRLNAAAVAGPAGAAWSPSTIHGHAARGTGILNNELYVGRLVWNRQRFVKNPDTGRRTSRLNSPAEWITKDVPQLRIVEDDVWTAVKSRQETARRVISSAVANGLGELRRPRHLFSGLTKCGTCGGGYTLASNGNLACFNARNRGTCSNRRTIKREELERRILAAMQQKLMDPKRFAKACEAYTRTINQHRREQRVALTAAAREKAAVEREEQQIIDAIANGFRTDAMRTRMMTLDAKKKELARVLEAKPKPSLHPSMADASSGRRSQRCAPACRTRPAGRRRAGRYADSWITS
jgi:site-specific DNA recombinase